jgi:transposase
MLRINKLFNFNIKNPFNHPPKRTRTEILESINTDYRTPEQIAIDEARDQKLKQDYEEKSKLVREIGMQVAERRKHQISDIKNRIRE